MNYIEKFARFDNKFRPFIVNWLPLSLSSWIYSNGRKYFIKALANKKIKQYKISEAEQVKLWDITFNCGLFNAAGMFKYGEGYYTCANIGAGAYLAGTTTFFPRKGNRKWYINHPFLPYPNSNTASNWMGLPNPGHHIVAKQLASIQKIKNCPIGASIAENPDIANDIERMNGIISGMEIYNAADVDFIELNFSCPNVQHYNYDKNEEVKAENLLDHNMIKNLNYISDNYLRKNHRYLPVIIKLSIDIDLETTLNMIDLLIDLGFDGINIGNTSVKYDNYLSMINPKEKKLYNKFTTEIGGGVSGEILKNNSLTLCKLAIEYINTKKLSKEFHCIRTGGISVKEDIKASKSNKILLNEWFTGFFDAFSKYGFNVYEKIIN